MTTNHQRLRVLLGITGSIAAYKTCELVSQLIHDSINVRVVMTANATQFISPLTFTALTGFNVPINIFDLTHDTAGIGHIELARWPQVMLVAPATANFIAKATYGIADDLLSTILMATTAPLLLVPAMNPNMFNSPTLTKNLQLLKARGIRIVGPAIGQTICGENGYGRMAESIEIIEALWSLLSPQDLYGVHVLVTAGPTHEYIDPIRFLSNPSTGRMGIDIARIAYRRGAIVTLIIGPTHLTLPVGINVKRVVSAQEMYEAVMSEVSLNKVIIKAAAVSDFIPIKTQPHKIKKNISISLGEFIPSIDILAAISRIKGSRILVGFAAETQNLLSNATQKLKDKKLDFIVANDISIKGSGFSLNTNKVTIIDSNINIEELPLMSKIDLASFILDKVTYLLSREK